MQFLTAFFIKGDKIMTAYELFKKRNPGVGNYYVEYDSNGNATASTSIDRVGDFKPDYISDTNGNGNPFNNMKDENGNGIDDRNEVFMDANGDGIDDRYQDLSFVLNDIKVKSPSVGNIVRSVIGFDEMEREFV